MRSWTVPILAGLGLFMLLVAGLHESEKKKNTIPAKSAAKAVPSDALVVSWGSMRPRETIHVSVYLEGGGKRNEMVCNKEKCQVEFPVKEGGVYYICVEVENRAHSLGLYYRPRKIEVFLDDSQIARPGLRIWLKYEDKPAVVMMY